MTKIAFFNTKNYDCKSFDQRNHDRYEILYFEEGLDANSATLAQGCKAIVAFVNDDLSESSLQILKNIGVELVALRSAGYDRVDLIAAAKLGLKVVRVPEYSPYAIAEHAIALLLTVNRKIYRSYYQTRDYDFALDGLVGFDLHGKVAGLHGAGRIGSIFARICQGLGMTVIVHKRTPDPSLNVEYVSLDDLFKRSDVLSLHSPLTPETHHVVNEETLKLMKNNAILINTSRGGLVDSLALYRALVSGQIAAAGLDVFENEATYFHEDLSKTNRREPMLTSLMSLTNCIITPHQAFLTHEALENIANVTFENLDQFFNGQELKNEVKA